MKNNMQLGQQSMHACAHTHARTHARTHTHSPQFTHNININKDQPFQRTWHLPWRWSSSLAVRNETKVSSASCWWQRCPRTPKVSPAGCRRSVAPWPTRPLRCRLPTPGCLWKQIHVDAPDPCLRWGVKFGCRHVSFWHRPGWRGVSSTRCGEHHHQVMHGKPNHGTKATKEVQTETEERKKKKKKDQTST